MNYSVSMEFSDLPAVLRRAGIYDTCGRKTSVCVHTCGVQRVFPHSESWLESACHHSGFKHSHQCLQPTADVPLCSPRAWCPDELTAGRCLSPRRSGWSGWIWRWSALRQHQRLF